MLINQKPSSFRAVMAGKSSGALSLQHATAHSAVSSTIFFSSVSSVVAPLGQPNYAAANAVLNAVANAQNIQVRPFVLYLCVCVCGGVYVREREREREREERETDRQRDCAHVYMYLWLCVVIRSTLFSLLS